jgi:phospholipase C
MEDSTMNLAAGMLLLFVSLGAMFAAAQTLPTFQHIIVIVQENRTPDNLFGGNTTFEPGVDLQQSQLAQPWCFGGLLRPQSQPSLLGKDLEPRERTSRHVQRRRIHVY